MYNAIPADLRDSGSQFWLHIQEMKIIILHPQDAGEMIGAD
jgi:hypothetical protein